MELAKGYDVDGDRVIYGCNLMLFRLSSDLSDEDAAEIDNRMKFVDHGVTVKKLKGAFDLILPLFVSLGNP